MQGVCVRRGREPPAPIPERPHVIPPSSRNRYPSQPLSPSLESQELPQPNKKTITSPNLANARRRRRQLATRQAANRRWRMMTRHLMTKMQALVTRSMQIRGVVVVVAASGCIIMLLLLLLQWLFLMVLGVLCVLSVWLSLLLLLLLLLSLLLLCRCH